MKKMLYLTNENLCNKGYVGIKKKIFGQLRCYERNDISTNIIYFDGCIYRTEDCYGVSIDEDFSAFTQKHLLEHVYIYLKEKKIDILYVRYMRACKEVIDFYKKVKEDLNIKIILDIPTFPYDNIKLWKQKYAVNEDKKYRDELKKYVSFIVSYGTSKKIYGIETINIVNGIEIENISLKKDRKMKTLNLIAVSTLANWHGYDRLIRGIYNYKISDNAMDITFKIVGDGPEKGKLQELTKQLKLEENIIFYGVIDEEDTLRKLFDDSDIAVSGLGIHRVGINEGGAIKNQEYCARGIPFILSANDEHFDNTCDFIKYVDSDDSDIDIADIIEFLNSEHISVNERDYAIKKFTWDITLQSVIHEL